MTGDAPVRSVCPTARGDQALEDALQAHVGAGAITGIERRLSPFRSSVLVEEIDVSLDDGTVLALVAKAVDWRALSPDAQRAKPPHVWDDRRELATYRSILSAVDIGTPQFFGTYDDESGIRYLLLERIDGVPLWQFGEFQAWREAACWLAKLHQEIDAARVTATAAADHLLRYDRPFYQSWMERALAFAGNGQPAVVELARHHRAVVDHLLEQPAAFIHGEFYSANVLVHRNGADDYVIRPLDWEMAAVAPALVDLSCLASGRWSDEQRADLADVYHRELTALGGRAPQRDDYLRTLDACLVHLSVQNLGWSDAWTPPAERAHDWLGEALRLCEKWQ